MSENRIRAVVRVRTLGPSGLNPPQIEVIDHLETLAEDGVIAEPDVDVWGMSMGTTQDDRESAETRNRVAEFEQWATEQEYSLQPAFSWRTADSEGDGASQRREIVTPLITLAIYTDTDTEETLQGVYPHLDGENVYTIHEGVEALESLTGDTEQSTDEQREQEVVPAA